MIDSIFTQINMVALVGPLTRAKIRLLVIRYLVNVLTLIEPIRLAIKLNVFFRKDGNTKNRFVRSILSDCYL